MFSQKKRYSAEFKLLVALEACKMHMPVSQIGEKFGVTPWQIYTWKRRLKKYLPLIFDDNSIVKTSRRRMLRCAKKFSDFLTYFH
jgi:transposase-like protein